MQDHQKLFTPELSINKNECSGNWIPKVQKDFLQKTEHVVQKNLNNQQIKSPIYQTVDGVNKLFLTNKQFAYLFGDLYIVGSSLNVGLPIAEAKSLLNLLLGILPSDLQEQGRTFLKKIQTMPENAKDIFPAAIKLANDVKNLAIGEDILLESGWNSHQENLWRDKKTGHYIIIRWLKTAESTYDIYIYNLGAGVKYHQRSQIKEEAFNEEFLDSLSLQVMQKDYYSPFLKIEGVKGNEIGLFQDKNLDVFLFERLIKIKHDYNIKDYPLELYLDTFRALRHKIVKSNTTTEQDSLALPHLAGSCVWFTLFYAAFKGMFEDQKLWEKTEWQMKDFAFLSHCDSKDVSEDSERKELCEIAAKGLLRQLSGLQGAVFSSDVVEKYQQRIESILNILKQNKPAHSLKENYGTIKYGTHKKAIKKRTRTNTNPTPKINEVEIEKTFPASFSDLRDVSNVKKELQKILDFPSKNLIYDVKIQIERFVKALPKPTQFSQNWLEMQRKDAEDILSLLFKVFDLYASDILSQPERLLVEQNTAWGLLAATYHFSAKINKDLKKYGIFYQSFLDIVASPLFVSLHDEDNTFYQELMTYFANLPQKRLFKMPSHSGDLIDGSSADSIPDVEFLLPIIQADASLSKTFQKKLEEQKYVYGHSFQIFKEIPDSIVRAQLLLSDDFFWETSWKNFHISLIRKCAYLAQLFNKKIKNFDAKSYFINSYVYTDTGLLLKNTALENEPCPLADLKNSFPRNSIDESPCIFNIESEGKENSALTKKNQKISSRLETTTCQKNLQSDLLLDYHENNFESLSDIQNQNLFIFSLFKIYPSFDPLREALERSEFVHSIRDFIQKGVNWFLYLQKPGMKLNVEATLFFMQLARRIQERLPSFDLRYSAEINQLLQRKNH